MSPRRLAPLALLLLLVLALPDPALAGCGFPVARTLGDRLFYLAFLAILLGTPLLVVLGIAYGVLLLVGKALGFQVRWSF